MANTKKNGIKSTQSYLDVADVRDGMIVLKDGNLRAVVAISSMNFALKSEEEQNAIIVGYQSFLNAIDFPIQILMQSRPMDVNPYLNYMRRRLQSVDNKLLQIQIAEYIEFVSKLVETSKIMSKTFFIIVPMNVNKLQETFMGRLTRIFNPLHSVVIDAKSLDTYKTKLSERIAQIQSGLSSLGLDSIQLSTEEVIELLYSSYNIGAASDLHSEALSRLDLSSNG